MGFHSRHGFTLIELSVVLVIIGLIIGGALVGQNLIEAAAVRAQITQIEKFNTAANTFHTIYGYLPGDMPAAPAAAGGFTARGTLEGEGDGNGVIEGGGYAPGTPYGVTEVEGETVTFWSDLSAEHLIQGTFNSASETSFCQCQPPPSQYFPSAAIGRGNWVYVWSGGMGNGTAVGTNGINYFSFSVFNYLNNGPITGAGGGATLPGLTVQEAYAIDNKIDDGLPQSGRVTAMYVFGAGVWWAGTTLWGTPPYTTATAGSSTSCFDNSSAASGTPGVAGAAQHYSWK